MTSSVGLIVPAVNISKSEYNYHVKLAAPGLKKEDFKLNLESNNLTVSVEESSYHQDSQKNYSKCEYSYTSFVRSFISFPNAFELTGLRNKRNSIDFRFFQLSPINLCPY